MAMLEVKVDGLALDMTSNLPVVILALKEGSKVLPIWIGNNEASVIAMELSDINAKRPLTHDLLLSVIGALSAKLEKVEITELKEQTFYAKLLLKCNGKVLEIDARPSDSIALALKSKAPIFAEESLFNIQATEKSDGTDENSKSLRDRLKDIDPEEFGKFSL
jgi:bifunctional DNase/RNase